MPEPPTVPKMPTDPERIRLIWDFFGPRARTTAEHHVQHLQEFATDRSLLDFTLGVALEAEGHWTAFMIVPAREVDALRAALAPQRGLPG